MLQSFSNINLRNRYSYMRLGPESDYYRLELGNMIDGNGRRLQILLKEGKKERFSVDNLASSRNQQFGTRDVAVGNMLGLVCGDWWRSGWWHDSACFLSGDLNVPYTPVAGAAQLVGLLWPGTPGNSRIRTSQIMIRPLAFTSTL